MTGRTAIVTGGTGALGQAVTARLLAAGVRVWIPYIVEEELEALRAQIRDAHGTGCRTAAVDVTDEAALGRFVAQVRAADGRIDILVNGVGGFGAGDLVSTSLADWDHLLTLNLTSAFIACRAVVPAMVEARSGRIVNIASRAVVQPMGGLIAYTVAKAGVITLTEALAQEVRGQGITVNAVLPSTMDTPANRRAMPTADRSQWVSTAAVAEVIAFLASDAAGAVSGATIEV